MMNYMYGGYIPQYQPMQQVQQPQQMQQQATPMASANSDERIWVQSQAQAEAYLVSPGSFVRMWNITEPVFYEKSCDAAGRPGPMSIYKYEKVENQPVFGGNSTNVQEQKFLALDARISALESIISKEGSDAEHISESNAADTAD